MNPKTITGRRTSTLPILPCLLLVAALLYGCGAGQNAGQGSDKQAVTPEGQFPIVKEKMTISAFLVADVTVDDYQNNDFVRYLEKKTNIYLELETAPVTEAGQKKNLLLASGDYPEIFTGGFSKAEQQIYGNQGVLQPLNNWIDEYGVNVRKVLADYPSVKANMSMPDGTIFSLPAVNDCYHCSYAQKMWIYQPWLDKLGLEMPTTTEEFKQVLIAFRDRDPNGNGIQDEIPLAGAASGWYAKVDGFIMNAFVYTDGNRLYSENGRIQAAFAQPGWKNGLAYMNDLYNEKLLSPDVFTQNTTQYMQLGENPDVVLMGAGPAGFQGVFVNTPGESGRWLEYKVVPALEGPDGVRYARYNPTYGSGSWAITDKAKNPEAAFRLGDAFYEEEVTLHNAQGREGIEWARAESGDIGINGLPAIWKPLVGRGQISKTSFWDQSGPQLQSSELRLGRANTGEESLSLEVILFEETKNKMEPYGPDISMIVPPLTYSEDIAAELVELQSALNTYVSEMLARFTIGDADIETGWDDYLAELEKIGLPRYLELVQEAYDKR